MEWLENDHRSTELPQMKKKIVIIGGGTISHIRNHLALCAPAYGETVRAIYGILQNKHLNPEEYVIEPYLTKMAGGFSFSHPEYHRDINLETNEDIEKFVDDLVHDQQVKVIFFNPALVDFRCPQHENIPSGKHAKRLETKNGDRVIRLIPTEKIIGKIRKYRKDIFVIGFKTTTNATRDEQYKKGLELLKYNSLNLVLANDTITRNNLIIVPEETTYCDSLNRDYALDTLVTITLSRMNNTFTRSTVVEGQKIDWNGTEIPVNLRTVVNHCIAKGAYKPFLGKTAGHFAVKIDDKSIITSVRKTNFNDLSKAGNGMVKVEYEGSHKVIAHGAKPSVGGMSQKIIFDQHSDAECIVHFHCPLSNFQSNLSVAKQWPNECGSFECGQNTSSNLKEIDLDGDKIKVVYLDNHGPNIVFSKKVPAEKVIKFIDYNFNLADKTGGLVG